MNVPEAVYNVLKAHPDGLSAKAITNEIIEKKLRAIPAKDPVAIVTRAINRHCIGIDRSYSCQDKFFSAGKDGTGTTIYKVASSPSSKTPSYDFVYPQQQIGVINGAQSSSATMKTRIMDAVNLSIRDLLGRYCFYVPNYQRSYSWKNQQIDEFLDDLFNIVHSPQLDARHFLGAITLTKHGSSADEMDLIDGQQRMTTVFITLYVIVGEYRSPRFADTAKGRADELYRKLAYLNDDGDFVGSRLILGEFNREFFEEFVISGYNKTDEEREEIKALYAANHKFSQNQAIYDAYYRIKLAIEERLDLCKDEADAYEYLKALHKCLFDRFEIVTMSVEEEADAFLIFETLNDRGLALSAVDLIKNKLFQTFAAHRDEFDSLRTDWETMCNNIEDKDNIKKFILHYWRAEIDYTSSQSLYKTCRDYIGTNGFARAQKIVHDLKKYSVYYNGFCDPLGQYPWTNQGLKSTLSDMNKMRYDLAHPILLAAIRRYPNDEDKLAEVAKLCLNFLIRYISVMKNKPSSIEKEISRWACDSQFSIDMIKAKFSAFASDAQFEDQLQTLSLPYASPLTHYLLCVYEAEGFNRHEIWTSPGRFDNTVEHILPQEVDESTPEGQYWVAQFGGIEECSVYRERLGNYAFLTQKAQSKALNRDFDHKKKVYKDDTDMRLTQELTQYDNWNPVNMLDRQKRMATILVKKISFN